MLRNIGAVIAGLVVGMLVNMALIQLNTSVLFPMPAGTSMEDPEQVAAYFQTLPVTAFLVVILAHLGQSFVGGWVAARLGRSRPVLLAMIIGGFSLLGGIAALMMLPGPSWMAIELPLYLVVAWLAGRMVQQSRQPPDAMPLAGAQPQST